MFVAHTISMHSYRMPGSLLLCTCRETSSWFTFKKMPTDSEPKKDREQEIEREQLCLSSLLELISLSDDRIQAENVIFDVFFRRFSIVSIVSTNPIMGLSLTMTGELSQTLMFPFDLLRKSKGQTVVYFIQRENPCKSSLIWANQGYVIYSHVIACPTHSLPLFSHFDCRIFFFRSLWIANLLMNICIMFGFRHIESLVRLKFMLFA